jgi:Cro/C1-type helix-turn-helix DNA-binding protein
MADRYTEETLRLVGLLKSLAKTKHRSIRSLEQQMGVGTSIFHKVLKGEVTLQMRHILMILDALEIRWEEFFQIAYPRRGAALSGSILQDVDEALNLQREGESPEFEERVKRVLARLIGAA